MRVDRLTEDEWEVLRDLRVQALTADQPVLGSSLDRELGLKESHWRMRLRASPWFVARLGDELVGLVCAITRPGAPTEERHLVSLWVAPDDRLAGVGRALLKAAEDWAHDDDALVVTVWLADEDVASRAFFAAVGYRASGEHTPMLRDPSVSEERSGSRTYAGRDRRMVRSRCRDGM